MKTKRIALYIAFMCFLSCCVVNNVTINGQETLKGQKNAVKPEEFVPKAIPVAGRNIVQPQQMTTREASPLKKEAPVPAKIPPQTQNTDPRKVSLTYNLTEQVGILTVDGKTVHTFNFSSGKIGYSTPTGTFRVGEKFPSKWSEKYKCWMPFAINLGIKDAKGNDDGYYNHEGRVPENNYPASHGCIRVRPGDARILYGAVPTGATVNIVGSAREHLQKHFGAYYNLLEFGVNDDPKIKRNSDGSLTKEFVEYVQSGKMEVLGKDATGKKVDAEDGVLMFEFMEEPWRQGVPVREYRSWMKGFLARK